MPYYATGIMSVLQEYYWVHVYAFYAFPSNQSCRLYIISMKFHFHTLAKTVIKITSVNNNIVTCGSLLDPILQTFRSKWQNDVRFPSPTALTVP